MATRTSKPGLSAAGVLDSPVEERERTFDLFRHWGFLEADLDPLGFLKPLAHPDLQIRGEVARQARHYYCGSIGADFMHIADPECRRWIQERMKAIPNRSSNGMFLTC